MTVEHATTGPVPCLLPAAAKERAAARWLLDLKASLVTEGLPVADLEKRLHKLTKQVDVPAGKCLYVIFEQWPIS